MEKTKENFDLQAYLTKGVEQVVADALKATLKDPRESAFMLKFAAASKAASKKRREAEDAGEHEGGCVLYEKRAQVEALLAGQKL